MDKIEDISYLETFELDSSTLEGMQQLANKHKIWQREGSYDNIMVLDGDSWSFYIEFGDGELVTARGYMASPRGFYEGIKEFLALFEDKYAQTREKADALLESLQSF